MTKLAIVEAAPKSRLDEQLGRVRMGEAKEDMGDMAEKSEVEEWPKSGFDEQLGRVMVGGAIVEMEEMAEILAVEEWPTAEEVVEFR